MPVNRDNVELIKTFYTCFQNLDGEGMTQCYHANAVYSDPVFQDLRGTEVGAMWRMLCAQTRDFQLGFRDIKANKTTGQAHWKADYSFPKTGRHVCNRVDSVFAFQDGKIIKHVDSFSFWKWSRMALGAKGYVFGWTPVVRYKLQKQASASLKKFITREHSYKL